MLALDLSEPSSPSRIGAWLSTEQLEAISVNNDYAFVNGIGGLQIIGVSAAANPQSISRIPTGASADTVVANGQFACVLDESVGIRLYEISDEEHPHPLGTYKAAGFPVSVALRGTNVYVADSKGGMLVLEIEPAGEMRKVGGYGNGRYYAVSLRGDKASPALPTDCKSLT